MRIAFIMLCHKMPEQINILNRRLSGLENADIYIHVDQNHDYIRNSIDIQSNIVILPKSNSFCIEWGSLNMIKATLELIKTVKASGKEYDYIWLISGQDYPICNLSAIEEKLQNAERTNFIETIIPGDSKYNRYKKLYEIPYPVWINKNNLFIKAFKRIYMILTGGYCHSFSAFVRRKPFPFDFYFGSQWWTLTSAAAYEILEYSDKHPEVLDYYSKSIIPDESFFQTLFMRGPYRDYRSHNLTFVNWGTNRRSPEILLPKDYDILMSKRVDYCFARKFDYPVSLELIEQIER